MNKYSKILHHVNPKADVSQSPTKKKKTYEDYEAEYKKTEVDKLKEQSEKLADNVELLQELVANQRNEFYDLRWKIKNEKLPKNEEVNSLKEQAKELTDNVEFLQKLIVKQHDELHNLKEEIKNQQSQNKIQLNEGLLNEPSSVKNSDPLTPLDQNFVTFDQLNNHYKLFINRIQEQVSTIGGGGAGYFTDLQDIENFIFVGSTNDLPIPVNGVINLKDNYTYFFTKTIDLQGSRLVAGQNTTILGGSSENCRIKSTGISTTTALLSSNYSLPLRNITLEAPYAINLDATGYGTQALDWFGVNFTSCAKVGIISSYNNFIMLDGAFLSSQDLTFDGTMGTIGFNQCLFSGNFGIGNTTSLPPGNEINQLNTLFPNAINGNGVVVIDTGNLWIRDKGGVEWFNSGSDHKILNIADTAVITRRFRSTVNSFVVPSGFIAIEVGDSATIPDEAFILETCNFSGPGGYLNGSLTATTGLKPLFKDNRGISNTFVIGQIYMQDNVTQTSIASTDTWTKVAGTTTDSGEIAKFTASNNRLTCIAAIEREYNVNCTISFRCEASNAVKFGFYDSLLAEVREASVMKHVSSVGELHHVTIIDLISQFPSGEYVEIHCKNLDSTTPITVEYMNFIIHEVA